MDQDCVNEVSPKSARFRAFSGVFVEKNVLKRILSPDIIVGESRINRVVSPEDKRAISPVAALAKNHFGIFGDELAGGCESWISARGNPGVSTTGEAAPGDGSWHGSWRALAPPWVGL